MNDSTQPQRNHMNLWLAAIGIAIVAGVIAAVVGESMSVGFRVETSRSLGFVFEVLYGIAGFAVFLLAVPLLYKTKRFYHSTVVRSFQVANTATPVTDVNLPRIAMNTWAYVIFVYGFSLTGAVAIGWAMTDRAVTELLFPGIALVGVSGIAMYIMLYRAWTAIQDGNARMSAGGVALMLIPFYNFYWLFQVFPGWAEDYNALAARLGAPLPQQDEPLFRRYCISIFVPIFGTLAWLVLAPKVIASMTHGVNALAPLQRPKD